MAKKGEACSSVHLARDPLGLGVDALGGAVAVRKGEPRDHGVEVSVQAPGEGVQMRQVGRSDFGDPVHECVGVVGVRRKKRGEVSDTGRELGHLGAGGGELGQELVSVGLEVVGPGQQHPGERASRNRVWGWGFRTGVLFR